MEKGHKCFIASRRKRRRGCQKGGVFRRREMFSRHAPFVGNYGIAISGNLGKPKRAGYRDRVNGRSIACSTTTTYLSLSLSLLRRIFGLPRIGRCSQRESLILYSRIARHVNHEAPRRRMVLARNYLLTHRLINYFRQDAPRGTTPEWSLTAL